MAWNEESRKLAIQLFEQGLPEKAIVREVRKRHKCNDKTVRRCLAGLSLVMASLEGRLVTEVERERYERLAGTEHYLRELSRLYQAHLDESRLAGASAYNLLPEPLLREVTRMLEAVGSVPTDPLIPADSLQQKFHLVLRQDDQRPELADVLDGHEDARRDYEAICSSIDGKLKSKLDKLTREMPQDLSFHPWDEVLLETFTSRIWSGSEGPVRPEHRRYDPDPPQQQVGSFIPNWGGYDLTQFPITSDQYKIVYRLHNEFREFAESFLPALSGPTNRLKEASSKVADRLEQIIVRCALAGA